MWLTKLYLGWHDFTERDAKLRKVYAAHLLEKIRNNKVRCRDLMQKIAAAAGNPTQVAIRKNGHRYLHAPSNHTSRSPMRRALGTSSYFNCRNPAIPYLPHSRGALDGK